MASHICPLCNGMQEVQIRCPQCTAEMTDSGRYMDQFDDYSPYLEIDGMKGYDGLPDDLKNHECPHVFECLNCHAMGLHMIEEMYIP